MVGADYPKWRHPALPISLFGQRSLLGWIYLTNAPPKNMSTNSWVSWIKPSVSKTLYPSGFTNLTKVLGSPYTNTAKAGMPGLNLTNGFLIYTNIGTNRGSHNTLTNLDDGNTNLSPTNHLVIAINTNSGVVTVTFQPTRVKMNIVAHGAVLRNQTDAAGYFLGTNESGAFILGPPQKSTGKWLTPDDLVTQGALPGA